jgi:hypothetical protein
MRQSTVGPVLGQPELVVHLDNMSYYPGNTILNLPGLTIGTTANTSVKIANSTQVLADFKGATVAAQEVPFTAGNAQFSGVHDILGNASAVQERVYALVANQAGAVSYIAGDLATGAGNAQVPERPATGSAPIGFVRIAVAAGTAGFRAGTTALNAAGITVAYNDGYPQRTHISAR